MNYILSTSRYAIIFTAGGFLSIFASIFTIHALAYIYMPVSSDRVSISINLLLTPISHDDVMVENSISAAIISTFPYADNLQQLPYWIRSSSESHDLDPMLLTSLIAQESSFRANVRSSAGAVGYGQVIPHFWESSCGLDVSFPENNIWCAAHALRTYIDNFGSLPKALAIYNVGPTNYRRDRNYRLAGYRYASSVLKYQVHFTDSRDMAQVIF